MKRLGAALAVAVLACGAACGGSTEKPEAEAAKPELGSVSSVVELRDALTEAGYACDAWDQSNNVTLAAESGACNDRSVLMTFASEGDLQAQLDTDKEVAGLFEEAEIEPDPTLVGPNWMFRAPEAREFAKDLGGTVVG